MTDALPKTLERLYDDGFTKGSDAYAKQAREELEKLQEDLRQKMLGLNRLTQNGLAAGLAAA